MEPRVSNKHFEFLDGLRFFAAIWVAVSHFGAPSLIPLLNHFTSEKVSIKLQGMFGSIFNGTQAVIVFFIVSGFCIHLSYAGSTRNLDVRSFYVARFIRICVPMFFAIGLAGVFPGGFAKISSVFWSLYAEMIYYLTYPALLYCMRGFGVRICVAVTLVSSILLSFVPDFHKGYFWTYGVIGTAALGLPIWLLGCLLAEKIKSSRNSSFSQSTIVCGILRCAILATAALTTHLHYNTWIHFKLSMLIVAPLCAFWIYCEFNQTKPSVLFRLFAQPGKATYSFYLLHMLAFVIAAFFHVPNNAPCKTFLLLGIAIAVSTIFYFLVEKPAHKIAVSLRDARGGNIAVDSRRSIDDALSQAKEF